MRSLALVDTPPPAHTDGAARFLEDLCALPRDRWLAIGAAALARDAGALAVTLDRVIAEHGLGLDAWMLRDGVATAAHLACGDLSPSRAEHRCLDAARRAAERTALALLAQPWLPRRDFEVMVGPFLS